MAKSSKSSKPVLYRHTSHAEWGAGLIVEETPSKFYMVFEDGGRRPFLNVSRYRDLLVPAGLDASEAEEIVAKIAKHLPKPTAKATDKKSKKKKAAVVEQPEEGLEADADVDVEVEDDREEDEEVDDE
ncbi:MAG: hypothetical protein QM765_20190 [Myxococcales bacterium]